MKTLECSRCHRLFKSTDERIFIHTKAGILMFSVSGSLALLRLVGLI